MSSDVIITFLLKQFVSRYGTDFLSHFLQQNNWYVWHKSFIFALNNLQKSIIIIIFLDFWRSNRSSKRRSRKRRQSEFWEKLANDEMHRWRKFWVCELNYFFVFNQIYLTFKTCWDKNSNIFIFIIPRRKFWKWEF